MRQIRLRVWNPHIKEMEYPGIVHERFGYALTQDGRVLLGWWENDGFHIDKEAKGYFEGDHTSDYVVMLSTGLEDKSGREIFEGDLLKFPESRGFYVDVVEWNEEQAGFETFRDDSEYGQSVSAAASEVVGNIYENPDVLYGPAGRKAGLF